MSEKRKTLYDFFKKKQNISDSMIVGSTTTGK